MNEVSRYDHSLTRRGFIRVGGTTFLAVISLVGCDILSTNPARQDGEQRQAGVGGRKGKEAPMLAGRVKSGELPPVEERLPDEPLVIEPVERMGNYGGELTSAILGPAEAIQMYRIVGYETLVRWSPDWTEIIPGIAESFEATEDAREFTFRLRRGLKWSDGKSFTADDVVFAQNDVFNNEDLYPAQPTNPARAEKVDDYAVRLVFEEPDGLFLQRQATQSGTGLVTKPFHYLKRFHEKYNANVEQLVEKEGLEDWIQLFDSKAGVVDPTLYWQNPDIPTLFGWKVTNPLGVGSRVVLERNPYYWKTDPDGSQLPYMDRVVYDIVADEEVILTRALNGDIDFQLRPVNALANKPVLAKNRERGGYRFFDARPSNMNTMILMLNLTHKDETTREIFNNKDFRIGLSHAINRQEIIDVVYQSQGEPWQAAPRPESDLYDEQMAKQYTEFSIERANEHLDRVLPEKDSQGVRLLPDGGRASFAVEFTTGIWPDYPDTLELVQGYWREVGVEMNVKGEDRSLFFERVAANDHDAVVWQGDGGWRDLLLSPRYYFPGDTAGSLYALPWASWYFSDGKDGQEPPESAQQQMKLYDRILATTDSDEQASAMAKILEIAREEFWVMGINLQPVEFGIAKSNLSNVPDSMPNSWLYPTPAPTNPEQYFFA